MTNLSNFDGIASKVVQYRITEWQDENSKTIIYLCSVMKYDKVFGDTFEATDHEQVFAWLRLMTGAYPGTMRNGAA